MFIVVIVFFFNLMIDCIIEVLANLERERLKYEDINILEWLKSMKFCFGILRYKVMSSFCYWDCFW